MIDGQSPEARLCLHLIASLCGVFTVPAERVTALGPLREHQGALVALNRPEVVVAARRMLAAQSQVEWVSACQDAARALEPVHKAEAMRLIAATRSGGPADGRRD